MNFNHLCYKYKKNFKIKKLYNNNHFKINKNSNNLRKKYKIKLIK